MSRSKGPEINFNPLIEKVQCDISFLSYLGLHQYAKQQKLIGRSRPMITKDMDSVKQRRLNFRLLVACIQQIVGMTHYDHNGRLEQINYVNVGNYAQLRLYGLLDRRMFALDTDKETTLTGWWPNQLSHNDAELLSSNAGMDTIQEHLSYNARAILEIGGDTFTEHLRAALQYLPDGGYVEPHSQRDPRNKMRVKNLSLNLQLIEDRPYRNLTQAPAQRNAFVRHGTDSIDVPCHIERLLNFRDILWPWVQTLSTPPARKAFTYVRDNFPGMQAVQIKIREVRNSAMETERREREAEEAREEREQAQTQLRERLVATYGEGPVIAADPEEGPPDTDMHVHQLGDDDVQAIDPILLVPDVHLGARADAEEPETIAQRLVRTLGANVADIDEGETDD